MEASPRPDSDDAAPGPDTVGVRELRQNLSVYLRRVKAGETLLVTERGHVVAELAQPRRKPKTWLQELIEAGVIRKPGPIDMSDLPPLKLPPGNPSLSDDIIRERYQDER